MVDMPQLDILQLLIGFFVILLVIYIIIRRRKKGMRMKKENAKDLEELKKQVTRKHGEDEETKEEKIDSWEGSGNNFELESFEEPKTKSTVEGKISEIVSDLQSRIHDINEEKKNIKNSVEDKKIAWSKLEREEKRLMSILDKFKTENHVE